MRAHLRRSGSPVHRGRVAATVLSALLAPPAWAATITVNDSSDALHSSGCAATGTGTCSLRDALTFANSNPGADLIRFNIPSFGVHTITPTSFLPILTDDAGVTIDGYSQPGSSQNTLLIGDNAVLQIEIDGSSTLSGGTGMLSANSSNNTIRGLVMNRYLVSDCVALFGDNNVVEGNFLGTDPTGLIARPCRGAIEAGGNGNVIGGVNPASRNVLIAESLNVVDLVFGSSVFQGNYVGTNRTGTAGLGSPFHGVAIVSDGNLIGGDTPGAGNLISGNGTMIGDGIIITSSNNTVVGNLIGTDAMGDGPIPNGGYGIHVIENTTNNSIRGNLIAFNELAGVKVGHSADTPSSRNAISANSIRSNGGLGIDLGNEGVTANDHCDPDTGPNNLQNFPVLLSAVPGTGSIAVRGTLDSAPSTSYRIEFFSSPVCDPSGHGEGQRFLGSKVVTTDPSCGATFDATLPAVLGPREKLTATATDPDGNTSEFSACISPTLPGGTLLPDGRATTLPLGAFGNTYRATLSADASYVVDVEVPFNGVGTLSPGGPSPSLFISRGDGVPLPSVERTDCAPSVVVRQAILPFAGDLASGPISIQVTDTSSQGYDIRVRIAETTLFCPRWSINGYSAFVVMQNTSDCFVSGEVILSGQSGFPVAALPLDLSPDEAAAIEIPTGLPAQFGSARLVHDGSPGALTAGIYMVNAGAAGANFRWPFQEIRSYGSTDGR